MYIEKDVTDIVKLYPTSILYTFGETGLECLKNARVGWMTINGELGRLFYLDFFNDGTEEILQALIVDTFQELKEGI